MLSSTDKGGIREALKQWSQRKSIPNDVLDDFIEISLSKANRALRIPPLEAYTFLPITTEGYAQLPPDFIEAKQVSVQINGITYLLERKDISEIDNLSNATGSTPSAFGRFGNYLRIAPWNTTDATVTLNLYYYFAIPRMADDSSSNWFTRYSPDVILYGALSELSDYVRDDEGSALWNGKFRDAVNILQEVENKSSWSGSTLSVSPGGSTTPIY